MITCPPGTFITSESDRDTPLISCVSTVEKQGCECIPGLGDALIKH